MRGWGGMGGKREASRSFHLENKIVLPKKGVCLGFKSQLWHRCVGVYIRQRNKWLRHNEMMGQLGWNQAARRNWRMTSPSLSTFWNERQDYEPEEWPYAERTPGRFSQTRCWMWKVREKNLDLPSPRQRAGQHLVTAELGLKPRLPLLARPLPESIQRQPLGENFADKESSVLNESFNNLSKVILF